MDNQLGLQCPVLQRVSASADLTFRYDHSKTGELDVAEADFKVYSHPGAGAGKWEQVTPFGLDTNSRTITASNVTWFSYFAIGENIHSSNRRTVIIIR